MGAIEPIKNAVRAGLERLGYGIMDTRKQEAFLTANIESLIHVFERCEGIELPANQRRARLLSLLLGTTMYEALVMAKHLHDPSLADGSVCEFGVAQGATSAFLANEILLTKQHLWLFDSFAGLPESTEEDQFVDKQAWTGAMSNPRSLVERRLHEIGFPRHRLHIVEGFFPGSADHSAPERIAFAYVDFDLYRPILDALRFIDKRLVRGGSVVVDDYNHPQFPGAQKAVHEFAAESGFEIVAPDREKFAVLSRRLALR